MCGIFGAISFSSLFNEKDCAKFIKLTNIVKYRGPDAFGYVVFNVKKNMVNNQKEFDIFLGHRRLSILDLSNVANQPFTIDGNLWIVYNGEIFNYIELRQELENEYKFKTTSDTEVILYVYKKYGENGFERLNGMWAFVIVDLSQKKIILSRDRFSIKPLYYMLTKNELYFSSEIKQLLPLLDICEINNEVMFAYLNQGLIDYNDETFFRKIRKVKAKHNVIIHLDTRKILEQKYWDYDIKEIRDLSSYEMIEKFRELFIDAVHIRLRSDVKVGALLSGGLDSSSITAIANDFFGQSLKTYSIVSRDKKYSEENFIDTFCNEKKIKNTKVIFDFKKDVEILNYINKVLYHHDEPFGSLTAVAHYILLEKIKRDSDIIVLLSGQGGDEVLMGYLKYFFFYLKDLINTGKIIKVLYEILCSIFKRTVIWQFKFGEARRYIKSFADYKSFIKIKKEIEPIWEVKNLIYRQILDIDKYSVPALTHYEDRTSMAHSLEIRLPFLDHRLVNYVLNLPISMKINKGWTKYILRQALKELPSYIRWRKDKQGFLIPEEIWLKNKLFKIIIKIFNKSVLEEYGIIDSKLFLEFYENFKKGKKRIWYTDVSRVFIAEIWARKFLLNMEDPFEDLAHTNRRAFTY